MHFLSFLDISVRYQVLCLFLSRSPLLDHFLSFLYKIAYFVKNDMSYNFLWHREHGNGKLSLLSSKFSSSTVLQIIKWYFFKFGYILQYKLFKMQFFLFRYLASFFPLSWGKGSDIFGSHYNSFCWLMLRNLISLFLFSKDNKICRFLRTRDVLAWNIGFIFALIH